jgi:hypothetical protein
MNCPKCGSEIDIFSSCETDKSVWQIRAENTKVELMLMKARAEKAEGELKAKGNNKIKCSCTDAVSEERCKTCIAVNHPQYLKVQRELKAIKARIDKNKINYIINHHLQKYNFNMGAFEPEPFIELVSNLIKQIGGEK